MVTKGIRFLFILMVTALTLSGCEKAVDEEPIEITLMHGWGGSLQTHKTMQAIYDEFDKQNPDILLRCLPSADSSIAVKNANDMLTVNKMPDIVSTNGLSYYVQNTIKQKKALNLMPYIEGDEALKNEIHPLVLKAWTNPDNTIYTVPDALEVIGYWYNKEYLKEIGFTGEDGSVMLPKTWPEFFRMCELLEEWKVEEEKQIYICALEDVQVVENFLLARLAGDSEEGLLMAEELPQSFDQQPMENTIRDIGVLYGHSQDTNTIDDARQMFIEGKTVLYFNGIWESELLLNTSLAEEIEYAYYPTNYNKTLAYVSPSSGYVIKDSKDPRKIEACIRFLKYILSIEVQEKIALETGQAPENPNIDYRQIAIDYPLLGKGLETINQTDIQIKTANSVWNTSVTDIFFNYVKSACQEEESYRQMIKALENRK